jgi:hypothetical protein
MANISLTAIAAIALGLAAATLPLERATAQCMLCTAQGKSSAAKKPLRPIVIEMETNIDFSKIGLIRPNQGGSAALDPRTGTRILGGALLDLGGVPVTGTVTIRGEPKEQVRVEFPGTVQLYNSSGASYPLSGFATTLKNNPMIGPDGVLRFTFGATLQISGVSTGTFRGSIPVTVDYR